MLMSLLFTKQIVGNLTELATPVVGGWMAEAKARVFGLCLAFLSLTLIAAPRRHRAADRHEAEPMQYPSHHAPRTISHKKN